MAKKKPESEAAELEEELEPRRTDAQVLVHGEAGFTYIKLDDFVMFVRLVS